jgi:hypothetical protein
MLLKSILRPVNGPQRGDLRLRHQGPARLKIGLKTAKNKEKAMKPELQKKLYDKYPEIFAQKDLPMDRTCMCWGIAVGDGWYDIIDNLCDNIMKIQKEKNLKPIEAAQVKEKFGGLRFYVNTCDNDIDNVIREAEDASYKTCEECGATEEIGSTKGYILTLCKSCAKEGKRDWVPRGGS